MNARLQRLGPVFADRPATFVIRPEDEGRLIAYIHNNPVRAGVVERARDSQWTSHASYVGARLAPAWLHIDEGLVRCGVGAAGFDDWVAAAAGAAVEENPNLNAVSQAARMRGALHVGTPTLSPTDVPLVARHFARIRPDPREILQVVSEITAIPMTAFASRRTEQTLVAARRVAVHAGKLLGLTCSELAAALGIGRQTASRLAATECIPEQRTVVDLVVRCFGAVSP
jgi:hypothetical protein